ncbi:MAG: hypothetical protein K0R50_951 [Eubacterium sp.]|nr:hypothetical protein [Eubacterium sp.]
MLTGMGYIKQSIETNLFFLRIMKEHIVFAASALTLKDAHMLPGLMHAKESFDRLLDETVNLAGGVVTPASMSAGDIVTEYTYKAEIATSQYTGLPINTDITLKEIRLMNNPGTAHQKPDEQVIDSLNRRILTLLQDTVKTQKEVLQRILNCKMYTQIYPLMLDHVIREAEHYLQQLQTFLRREDIHGEAHQAAAYEAFWNDIMSEHAKFIRGLMDPVEEEIIRTANGFSEEFDELTAAALETYEKLDRLHLVTRKSIIATTGIRNFKEQGTEGILACNIRSIMLPLLSDHVLREANHYLKNLRLYTK